MQDGPVQAARVIRDQRYADAVVVFAAGSLIRGEGTAYSDLDLVVIYRNLPAAYRESFRFEHLPVEAFVHDPETLNYFFLDVDRPSGVPALPQMVLEGIEIPGPNDTSRSLKELAAAVIAMGPPPLSPDDERKLRYGITDLIDDIRSPRSNEELIGSGARLFEDLANYHLRRHGLWSATGKAIPRVLKRANLDLAVRYCRVFEGLFKNGEVGAVIALAEELLTPSGGLLFEGHRLDAPSGWRKPLG